MMVRKPRIMIVEDEHIVAEDIHRSLKAVGYEIAATASSGPEALKQAEISKPDLVLMDIVIDGRMNGIETARQVRDELDLPVVFLTAYGDKDTLEQAKLTEPLGYLLKPFDNRELQITIEMGLYRHRMEKRLKQSEERYRGLFETMAQGVLYFDSRRRIIAVNPAAEHILATPMEDLLDGALFDPGWESIREDGSPIAKEDHPVVVCFHKGKPRHEEVLGITTPGGDLRWLRLDTVPIPDPKTNRVVMVFTTFMDITQRKVTELSLQQRNEQLNSLHILARQVGGMLDLKRLLETALKEVRRLAELSAGAIYVYSSDRERIEECVHSQVSSYIIDGFTRLHEEKSRFRASLLRGMTRWMSIEDVLDGSLAESSGTSSNDSRMHCLVVPINVGNRVVGSFILYGTKRRRPAEQDMEFYASIGNHIGLAVKNARLFEETRRALEELQITQEKLVESEKLASLGALTSNIVHEIGNPLAAISNAIQVLEKHVDLEDRLQELFDIMKWETDRLQRSIEQLREFSRPRPLRFESIPPRGVVEKAIKVMNQDLELVLGKRIVSRFSKVLPDVWLDQDAFEQVIVNLVKNGLQAVNEGGVVEVRLTNVGRSPKRVRLQVRDNGSGIPKEDLTRVFEPYYSTKARGMGLGMAIVKQVVDAHGGTIHVESDGKGGTRVLVDIPVEKRNDG